MVTGEIETHLADVVVLATGGYGNVFYLSTNAMGCNVTADLARAPQGRLHGQPLLHADPPDLHPGLRRAPVQADADERVAAQRRPDLGAQEQGRTATRTRATSPRRTATTTSSGSTRPSATWSPATSRRAQAKNMCDEGRGVGPEVDGVRRGVYLDFADAIERLGRDAIEEKYGNLFDMYAQITGENPYEVPMRIYPAVHYVMGGLWVDYDLQSTIPGLFVTGEANFSDHGANRLGASALMQGLADGYFVLPNTIRDYLADGPFEKVARGPPGRGRGAAVGAGAHRPLPDHQRHPQRRLLPPRARQHHVGVLRHGAHRGRPEEGHRPDPHAARRVLAQRQGARHRREPQPVAWRRPAAWPTSSSSAS